MWRRRGQNREQRKCTTAVAALDTRIAKFRGEAENHRHPAELKSSAATDDRAVALLLGKSVSTFVNEPGAVEMRNADAAERAADRLMDERPALIAKKHEAEVTFNEAALIRFRASRDAAYADALKTVAALVPSFARLIAADIVRDSLLGARFAFDATRHSPVQLWSGAHQTRAILKAIPGRFGGEALSAQVEAEALLIAGQTLRQLEVDYD